MMVASYKEYDDEVVVNAKDAPITCPIGEPTSGGGLDEECV